MKFLVKTFFLIGIWVFAGILSNCQPKANNNNSSTTEWREDSNQKHKKKKKNKRKNQDKSSYNSNTKIPAKVYEVLAYIQANKRAPEGYVGGRRFGNFEKNLPQKDDSGHKINYQEWDVNPKQQGRNRGAERLVTGSDGRAWFTQNHYDSFVEVRKP
jgi:ribonuclease T1